MPREVIYPSLNRDAKKAYVVFARSIHALHHPLVALRMYNDLSSAKRYVKQHMRDWNITHVIYEWDYPEYEITEVIDSFEEEL